MLTKKQIVLSWLTKIAAKLSSTSLLLIRIATVLYFPLFTLSNYRRWKINTAYLQFIRPEKHPISNWFMFYHNQTTVAIWQKIIYDAFRRTAKYNDFSQIDAIDFKLKEGKSALLLGIHYGTMCNAFVFNQYNINPVILSLSENIPDISNVKHPKCLSNDMFFKSTYDGFCYTGHEEKKFVEKVMQGKPGIIMIDVAPGNNRSTTPCLGINYPLNRFPFKLALKHDFPVFVIWFSKMKQRGFMLNAKEINFSSVEQGMEQYATILSEVIKHNPYLWHSGNYLIDNLQYSQQ